MFSIRPALADDADRLAAIFLAARRQAFWWRTRSDFQLEDYAAQTAGEIVHVAEDPHRGDLVGFIAVWLPDRFVHHLYVDPARQGEGIGTQLLDSLDEWLPRPHALKCLAANQPALEFYRKRGWIRGEKGADALGEYWNLERP